MSKKIVGYTAGVYDLFHIGHLNLLKNAKQHCDYLIVGINSDEACFGYKNKYPVIPVENRMKIVEAIRYVDEVVRVDNVDKMAAYEKHHFDKIFVGNDHEIEKQWQDYASKLRSMGSEVVFLPHTDGISSTLIRKKLNTEGTIGNG